MNIYLDFLILIEYIPAHTQSNHKPSPAGTRGATGASPIRKLSDVVVSSVVSSMVSRCSQLSVRSLIVFLSADAEIANSNVIAKNIVFFIFIVVYVGAVSKVCHSRFRGNPPKNAAVAALTVF
jgi:hypothetical protein